MKHEAEEWEREVCRDHVSWLADLEMKGEEWVVVR